MGLIETLRSRIETYSDLREKLKEAESVDEVKTVLDRLLVSQIKEAEAESYEDDDVE